MILGLCAHCGHAPSDHNDMGTSCNDCLAEVAEREAYHDQLGDALGERVADHVGLAEYDCFDLDV